MASPSISRNMSKPCSSKRPDGWHSRARPRPSTTSPITVAYPNRSRERLSGTFRTRYSSSRDNQWTSSHQIRRSCWRGCPFFEHLSPEYFKPIAGALAPRTALPGENIIKQGERGRSLFLIARGVVAVLISATGGTPRRVASLHAGDFFGEMALLSDAPRNATVQAVTGCQLYELAKKDVDRICETLPGIRQALVSASESRSSDTVAPARRSTGHYEL